MPSGRLMFHNLERPDRVLITSLLSLNDSGR
jgi:hypothetical protein